MIRVAVVDDSPVIRQLLVALLESDPALQVVGTAGDPYEARELIKAAQPDVLTLDIEMPRMDGLTFLGNLMRLRPIPTVMVSSLTEHGADVTLRALELGAVDYIAKPMVATPAAFAAARDELVDKVKTAAAARPRAPSRDPRALTPPRAHRDGVPAERLLAIGASTGGTEAIRAVLEQLPADVPGTVIAQHIPAVFSRRFAERLHEACAMDVREAEDGQPILHGHAYVAPGGRHLTIGGVPGRWFCRLTDTPPVHRQRPSVDVLFESVARKAGNLATGVILTGMGADGADGLLAMRDRGALTIAQDEASSVVWGMPGVAVKLGAACEVLALGRVAGRLIRRFAEARP